MAAEVKKSIFKGRIIDLWVETVTLPNGATAELEIITHPGAAAVVPMKDETTVVMIRQYRHAVGGFIFFTTPGFTNEVIHIFLGKDLQPGTQDLGADEVLEILEMPIDKAIALIKEGTIRDGKTIIGLQMAYLQLKGL